MFPSDPDIFPISRPIYRAETKTIAPQAQYLEIEFRNPFLETFHELICLSDFAFSYFAGGWNDAGIRVLARQTGYAPDREQ